MIKIHEINNLAYVRLLHAVPDAPAVDVYADDELIAKKLAYKDFTQYKKVKPKQYNIKIYPAGNTKDLVYETNLNIPDNTIHTIAVTGLLEDLDILAIEDTQIAHEPDKSCIRFIHLSQEAPAVDITLPNGTKLFEDVSYEEVTDYKCINPGKYTLQARIAGTNDVVLTVPNIRLQPNNIYSAYAVGLVNGEPSLQVLIPLDGNTYIDM